jgi:hypothetical protein
VIEYYRIPWNLVEPSREFDRKKIMLDLFPVREMQIRVIRKKEKGREPYGAAKFNTL